MVSAWNGTQLFSSASTEWSTPQALYDHLHSRFNFSLDAASNGMNSKCPSYLVDALTQPWDCPTKAVWLNPPWGRGIGRFLDQAILQSREHKLTVVCLVPACTDTLWWSRYAWAAAEIWFLTGRLHFVREDGHTGPCTKGAAILVYTPWHTGDPQTRLMNKEEWAEG
jgi:site-specific DNA-methyltransferase (adenine-specific)|tara:strand:+ start:20295 stop:20795 length:501 start_codon:yes stop_codon:yes gene_type:complete